MCVGAERRLAGQAEQCVSRLCRVETCRTVQNARVTTIIGLWPSNTHVQAALGVGSVNFRTVDFGGAFFNWPYCVLCVLSDTWLLRCVMFILCAKEAVWGMIAFVASFGP